jgi:hypothetical protein
VRKCLCLCVSIFSLLFFFALLSSRATSQATLGSVEGTVTDSSGAAVVDVEVKALNLNTNLELTTTTTKFGSYRFFNLPPGPYSVSFTKQSFQKEIHSPVTVNANRTSTESATLKSGPCV